MQFKNQFFGHGNGHQFDFHFVLLNYITFMPRGRKPQAKCQRHDFMLKPMKHQCYFSQTITNSFCNPKCEKKNRTTNQKQVKQCLSCPIYNNDRNAATATFMLQSQKAYYLSNYSKLKEQYQKKIGDFAEQKQQLLIPKPRSRNNYCNVCRQTYLDYLQHIKSEKHRRQIRASKYNTHILNMIDKFQTQNKIKKVNQENAFKRTTNSTTNSFSQDSSLEQINHQEFQQMGRPRKKIKRETIANLAIQNDQNLRFNNNQSRAAENCLNIPNYQDQMQRINGFNPGFQIPMSNFCLNQYQNHCLLRESLERMNNGQLAQPMSNLLNPFSINSFQFNRCQPFMRGPENHTVGSFPYEQFRGMNFGQPEFKYNSSQFQSTALYSPPPHFYTPNQLYANIIMANQCQLAPRPDLVVIDSE